MKLPVRSFRSTDSLFRNRAAFTRLKASQKNRHDKACTCSTCTCAFPSSWCRRCNEFSWFCSFPQGDSLLHTSGGSGWNGCIIAQDGGSVKGVRKDFCIFLQFLRRRRADCVRSFPSGRVSAGRNCRRREGFLRWKGPRRAPRDGGNS